MSPDQILALKKQGVDPNALISQHAMDIANEQGVDMGLAMAEARRNVQSVDDTLAGTATQETLGLGAPARRDVVPTASDLQNLLMTSPDQPTGLTSAQKYAALYGDKGAYDITGGNLMDINAQALAGLSDISGLAEDRMRQEALMDMPTGMTPAQKYAATYGDTGAYDITGGNLKDINLAAMSALAKDPTGQALLAKDQAAAAEALRKFKEYELAGKVDTSQSEASSYDRLISLGYTPTQARWYSSTGKPTQALDIDAAMEGAGYFEGAPPTYSPTALVSPEQPFGGGAKGSPEYTDVLNTKLQNTRVNKQVADLEYSVENTQGNVEWQLEQLNKFKVTRPKNWTALTDAQRLKLATDKANVYKKNTAPVIDELQDSIADNPTNDQILEAQLAKSKVDRVISVYKDMGIDYSQLEGYENFGINDYINNNVNLKTIENATKPKDAKTFSEFAGLDASDIAEINERLSDIANEVDQTKKDTADTIIIKKLTDEKNKADADANANPSPANKAKADVANKNLNNAILGGAVVTTAATPAAAAAVTAATPAAGAAVTGALGTGLGGAFSEFIDPRSRADIIADMEADPYRGYEQVLAQMSANLPATALTPQYERYLQRNVLPQMQTAFEAAGGGMEGTQFAPTAGSPFSAFEQFVRGGGGRLTSQGYQDLINEANLSLQAQAPTDRQAYLQSLYTSPESQRNLYAQGLKAGASGAVGDVIDRMVNRRYLQQQFQAPTTAFLPTALAPRTAYQTPSAIVGSGVPELDDAFFDYRKTSANPLGAGGGAFTQ